MALKIWVTVKPQAKKAGVTQDADGTYRVSVHAPAREGKANHAVIALLADHFAVPKSSIKILRGNASRKKWLEIG
jgi:uncharacterized protein (TIGR00251 family)